VQALCQDLEPLGPAALRVGGSPEVRLTDVS
jgi:hypothetical protein